MVVKCFEHKKDGLQSFASHIDWIWCVQLVHSLEFAVVVIILPYISGLVMLLWEQSNGNEASDVYMCCSYVYASMCLLDICWEEIHLHRLGHFGYSVACLQACCLTLSWQVDPSGVATYFSIVCALRWAHADLSARKGLVSDTVWDLCLQLQTRTIQREEPLHPTHRRLAFCACQAKAFCRLFF